MENVIKPLVLDTTRFKKEFSRLHGMTTYQRAMDKAIDSKADKWLSYTPLSKAQLFDTVDESVTITIVCMTAGGQLTHARSTRGGPTWHNNLTLIARPTEIRAILHAQGLLTLDSDFVVVRQEPNKELRWCIICKSHHEVSNFVPHKRYLNGLSFACKTSLKEAKLGVWRKVA